MYTSLVFATQRDNDNDNRHTSPKKKIQEQQTPSPSNSHNNDKTQMSLPQLLHEVYDNTTTTDHVVFVLTASLLLYISYKTLSHPAGPGMGAAEALYGLVWLMVGFCEALNRLCGMCEEDLTALA